MNKNQNNFNKIKEDYFLFLKKKKIFKKSKIFFYENNVEKMNNWSNVNLKKTMQVSLQI